jgi:hypothetical protein
MHRIRSQAKIYTVLVAILLLVGATAFSQELQLSHIPANIIPELGKKITLEVKLLQTKQFDIPIRLIAVSDGKLIDITKREGILDIADVPTYTFELMAPVENLSYSFSALGADGSSITTEKFTLDRQCQVDIKPVVATDTKKIKQNSPGDTKELTELSSRLLLEIQAYESAITTFEEIKNKIKTLGETQTETTSLE